MPSHPQRLALTATTLCLLTACTPTTPPPTPSPAPSYRCTPETGGDEHDCTQAQHDDMLAKDKLYTQAEAVYRKYLAEDARILRAGGISTPSPALLATTGEEFLADAMDNYKAVADRKVTAAGPQPSLVYFRRAPGRSKTGSIVSATVCVDGSSLEFFRSSKSLGKGRVIKDETYFAEIDGALKVIGADGSRVKSCE